jgi:hypothetical protein
LSSIDTKLDDVATEATLSSIDTKVSTATKQDTGNTSLASIDTKLSSQATSANQTTTNNTLSTISGKMTPATATLSNVAANTSSVSVLASNASRKGFIIHNDSDNTCYVAFAASATTSAYTFRITPGSTYDKESSIYTGVISCIWGVSSTGALRVTELS